MNSRQTSSMGGEHSPTKLMSSYAQKLTEDGELASKRSVGSEPKHAIAVLQDCKLYKEPSLNSDSLGLIGKGMLVQIPVLPRARSAKAAHWINVFSETLQ